MKIIAADYANDCTTKCQVLFEMNLNIQNPKCRPEAGEKEDKTVSVWSLASRRGWRRRLVAWMATRDVAALTSKEFITVRFDSDRGPGVRDPERRFVDKSLGLLSFAFLEVNGKYQTHRTKLDGRKSGIRRNLMKWLTFETGFRGARNIPPSTPSTS